MKVRFITFHDFQHGSTHEGCQPRDWCFRLQNSIDWNYPHLESVAKNDPTPMAVYEEIGRGLLHGYFRSSSIKGEYSFCFETPVEVVDRPSRFSYAK